MGKVIPADDPVKLTEFVTNKYEAFSKVYETCKSQSENIKDISVVETSESNSLSVKVQADEEVMTKIKETANEGVNVTGNVVTAKSD